MLFLIAVVVLYYAIPRYRLAILAVANALFYMYAGVGYFFLFMTIVATVYFISKGLAGRYRKLSLGAGLTIVIGNLVFFKYSMFVLQNVEQLLGIHFQLEGTVFAGGELLLPIGISFYSFQLIAYLMDVYRGKLQPSRSLLEFWVFIALFAHSAAGPILRGNDFLPQLRQVQDIHFRSPRFKLGLAYIALGLVKKLVLVEQIAPYVNDYFSRVTTLNGTEAWIAAYLFAFQIYLDFSAYSEMAVGIGCLLGLRLDLNFRTPYLSGNANEFWRRWHITLSQWIRDYIFIPLGGSRVANWRIYANLIAAMAISGLWHGAAWTFIIWGVYHGILSAGHRVYKKFVSRLPFQAFLKSGFYKGLAIICFFHMTVVGWVFFRSESFIEALVMLKRMAYIQNFAMTQETYKMLLLVVCLYALHILEAIVVARFSRLSFIWQSRIPTFVRGGVYAILAMALFILLTKGEASSFIYFQF